MLRRLLCNCCRIQQLQFSAGRRRLHVRHRREIRRRLEQNAKPVRAMLLRAKPWHGEPRHGLGAMRWREQLWHDLRWDAPR